MVTIPPKIRRVIRSRNPLQKPEALRPLLEAAGDGVLVAGVQGVVGPGHEHFPPLEEAGRKKARNHANDDFLDEGGVHCSRKEAKAVPQGLTKSPIAGWP